MKIFAIFLVCASINSLDDTLEDFRKHYGLSFHHHCQDYVKTFKCLTACKSIGFQIFRMDKRCKCTCHDMRTTTTLPFFMWRTNGTTRKVPVTFSPNLYHVAGTLSPATYSAESSDESSDETSDKKVTKKGNATEDAFGRGKNDTTTEAGADGNSTSGGNETEAVTGGAAEASSAEATEEAAPPPEE